MRVCFDAAAATMPLEKQGLEPGPGAAGPGVPAAGLHAALAPLGPLGSLARTVDGLLPSPATLNLSLNVPLPFHVPYAAYAAMHAPAATHQLRDLKELFLASLIRGIYQPAGPLISTASSASLLAPPKVASGGRSSPPANNHDAAAPDNEAGGDDGATSTSGAAAPPGSMPPPSHAPPHAYRYPAHGAYPPPYYSPYAQQYYPGPGPQYQDPCYPNYYHRALHYRRQHYAYLAPGPASAPDSYAAPGAPALTVPAPSSAGGGPLGAVHQMQMVVSSGPPAGPGGPPPGPPHPGGPSPMEYAPVEPYYSPYPPPGGQETATFRCPCPMQSCPKNVHTGPLTGDGKGPNQMQPLALTLPPVALGLPGMPPEAQAYGPPSPARGSAGMPPPPSPVVGAAHRYQGWDSLEGPKSVVKQDPGTPPEAPREPPALVLATRHNLIRQNVPPHEQQQQHVADAARDADDLADAVKLEAGKDKDDVKDVKHAVAVAFITTTVTTTTIEEATQTTPPPEGAAAAASQGTDKRVVNGVAQDEPPSKKTKKQSKKDVKCPAVEEAVPKGGKPKAKQPVVAPVTLTVAAATTACTKAKAPASKGGSRKAGSSAGAGGSPSAAPGASGTSSTPPASASSAASTPAGSKGRAQKRTSSLDSNKSTGSAKSSKRSDSQDKSAGSNSGKGKAASRDSSKNRSRSSSRSRIQEEEEEAARVIAAAELPEGVPVNQCRRLIAAQKKLILRCEAKKERERARLAKQEAARAARLAALVSAAEAKKATGPADEDGDDDEEEEGEEEVQQEAGAASRLSLSPTAPTSSSAGAAPAAATPHAAKHHHHHHNNNDTAVDRTHVEELAQRAGLDVPACLTISQSELRLLESCAEPKTPKYSNGWHWRGQPYLHRVFLNCDDPPVLRKCFPAMQHEEGDNITLGDTILLKSGTRVKDLPYVARVIHLWENPEDGEMMLSLVWFYRPEHTDQGRRPCDRDDEIFSSRHKDINSVACIEDKCYVLTFNEYCRYRKTIRRLEEGLSPPALTVPGPDGKYPRHHRLPPGHVAHDMVFFCRKIYDFRLRRLQKNIL